MRLNEMISNMKYIDLDIVEFSPVNIFKFEISTRINNILYEVKIEANYEAVNYRALSIKTVSKNIQNDIDAERKIKYEVSKMRLSYKYFINRVYYLRIKKDWIVYSIRFAEHSNLNYAVSPYFKLNFIISTNRDEFIKHRYALKIQNWLHVMFGNENIKKDLLCQMKKYS
ncbi:MAG: hypothetical protein [Caudoviricetes sp.]|nr:MAG: hypothetical protein [Caudoviricetes sp.]